MFKPWKRLKEKVVYTGWRVIKRMTFELPNGRPYDFDIMDDPPAASVLAFTADDRVILVKQYRPGPVKFLIELPGGVIDPKEKPEVAAARELLEETGYAGELQFIGTHVHDAYSTRTIHAFIAKNCAKVGEPHDDPREPVEVALMTIDQFRSHLRSGELSDVPTGYIGLDFLGLL